MPLNLGDKGRILQTVCWSPRVMGFNGAFDDQPLPGGDPSLFPSDRHDMARQLSTGLYCAECQALCAIECSMSTAGVFQKQSFDIISRSTLPRQ